MKHPLLFVALVALLAPFAAAVQASTIQTACLRSDRPQATRTLCSCIQSVADNTLTRSEQRQAARFFRDPDRAQTVRMSRDDRDRAFWQRYRAFATAAEQRCIR